MEEKIHLREKLIANCGTVPCQDQSAFPTARDLCEELSCRLEMAEPGIELNELSHEINGLRRITQEEAKQILAELGALAVPPPPISGPRFDGVPYTSWQINNMNDKIQQAINAAKKMVTGRQPIYGAKLAALIDSAKKLRQATKARPMKKDEIWQHGPIYILDSLQTSTLVVLLVLCILAIWLLKKSADHFTQITSSAQCSNVCQCTLCRLLSV